jgi:hypothetical protein
MAAENLTLFQDHVVVGGESGNPRPATNQLSEDHPSQVEKLFQFAAFERKLTSNNMMDDARGFVTARVDEVLEELRIPPAAVTVGLMGSCGTAFWAGYSISDLDFYIELDESRLSEGREIRDLIIPALFALVKREEERAENKPVAGGHTTMKGDPENPTTVCFIKCNGTKKKGASISAVRARVDVTLLTPSDAQVAKSCRAWLGKTQGLYLGHVAHVSILLKWIIHVSELPDNPEFHLSSIALVAITAANTALLDGLNCLPTEAAAAAQKVLEAIVESSKFDVAIACDEQSGGAKFVRRDVSEDGGRISISLKHGLDTFRASTKLRSGSIKRFDKLRDLLTDILKRGAEGFFVIAEATPTKPFRDFNRAAHFLRSD